MQPLGSISGNGWSVNVSPLLNMEL